MQPFSGVQEHGQLSKRPRLKSCDGGSGKPLALIRIEKMQWATAIESEAAKMMERTP